MRTLLTVILSAVAFATTAGSVRLAWDPSPSPGVTNYVIKAGTNSVQSGNTNWFAVSTGTNCTVQIRSLAAGRWFFRAVAVADGVESEPSNQVEVEFPEPPTNFRTVAVESIPSLSATNHIELFRLVFLP